MTTFTITIADELLPYTLEYGSTELYIRNVLIIPLLERYSNEQIEEKKKQWKAECSDQLKKIKDDSKVNVFVAPPAENPNDSTQVETNAIEMDSETVNNESKAKTNLTFDKKG